MWTIAALTVLFATLCDGFQQTHHHLAMYQRSLFSDGFQRIHPHRAINYQRSLFVCNAQTSTITTSNEPPMEAVILPDKKKKGAYLDETASQRTDRFNQIWKAMTIYKQLNNNSVDVPPSFVVPSSSDDWPSDLKDFPLGRNVFRIKYRGDYPEYSSQFASIGFQTNKKDYKFELFMKALTTYRDLHEGKTTVPRFFVVPDTDPWPKECHGMKLGVKVSCTRSGRSHFSPECIQRLNEVGFVWVSSFIPCCSFEDTRYSPPFSINILKLTHPSLHCYVSLHNSPSFIIP